MRRHCGCLSGYDEIVADKAEEALRELRIQIEQLQRRAVEIERAWRNWDWDTLIMYGVVSREIAARADAEQQAQWDYRKERD